MVNKKYKFCYLFDDMKTFTLLENIAVVIDLVLNPKALDYPIAVGNIPDKSITPFDYLMFKRNTGHLVTISYVGDKFIYIRWL